MRKVIVMLLLSIVSGGAAAAWVLVGDPGDNKTYIDPATIRRSGDMVKVWVMNDFKITQVDGSEKYLSEKRHNEYDCKNERRRIHYYTRHSGQMGVGNVVYSHDGASSNWRPIAPGSVGEAIWKMACGKK